MLDVQILRLDVDTVARQLKERRSFDLDVGVFTALESDRKRVQSDTESLQAKRNSLSKEIGVAKKNKDEETFLLAQATFGEARDSDESAMELKGECSYMMGECLKEVKDYEGASRHFDDTTSRYASSGKWAEKAFDQAISCYERLGKSDFIDRLEKRRDDWLRRYQ